MKINWQAGFAAIKTYFVFKWQTAFQPKTLKLTREQVDTVRSMFVAGSMPEAIGRAMDAMYKRTTFKYFRVYDDKAACYSFLDTFDYEMDGMEYVNAAMMAVGALKKKRGGWYYDTTADMVQTLAAKMNAAPILERKGV